MAVSLLENRTGSPRDPGVARGAPAEHAAVQTVPTPERDAASGPLVGLRVLEMGSLVAGPFCGRLLGEFGAEVIKVEAPRAGDQLRDWGKRAEGHADSLWWYVHGRNKRCLTLNLKDPRGQELARRLAAECDVLVENFRPGKMAEWGLDYERLAADNPGLVYVSISGFGQTGPYRDRVGFGSIAESMGGLRHLTGYPDRPPTRVGLSIGDSLAGIYAALGALMAIHHRDRNGGRGQLVDVALYEAIFSLLESAVPEYDRLGVVRERKGTRLSGTAPSNTYPTRDGHLIVIGGNNDAIFRRLMRVIGRPGLADDPRFLTNQDRLAHVDELDRIIGAWTAGVDRDAALRALEAADVPVGPIYSVADIFQDPHYWARQMLVQVEDERLGSVIVPGVTPKLSATPGGQRWLGPDLGADTDAVLHELLGLRTDELSALHADGVI